MIKEFYFNNRDKWDMYSEMIILPEYMNYKEFLNSKRISVNMSGFDCEEINDKLFDFQKELVRRAVKAGKYALFADTGLGKTFCQLEWSRIVNKNTQGDILIFAPLCVNYQTIKEGQKLGIEVNPCRSQSDVKPGINISNFEMLEHFEADKFKGLVLDESGIIKNFTGKIRNTLNNNFFRVPYKLCCTATPAPNDYTELLTHAEFLNIMKRKEALSMFFIHDSNNTANWTLKTHSQNAFQEWLNQWATFIKLPSDIGDYDDNGYILKPYNKEIHIVDCDLTSDEQLFRNPILNASNYYREKKYSIEEKIEKVKTLLNDEQWIIWCETNDESQSLKKAISNSVEIKGSDSREYKEREIMNFIDGRTQILISKPKIFGYGLNLQNCHNAIYFGMSYSFEKYYQSLRRIWRFGQTKQVNIHIILSYNELNILKNVDNKELLFNNLIN